MTATPNPSPDADQLAELERLQGCLARIRGSAFLYAGQPASMDPAVPLSGGREAFAVIVRTCDAVAAEAGANDDLAADVARHRAGLVRVRMVALIRAEPGKVSLSPGVVDVQRDAFGGLAAAASAALEVAANDVVVSLADRRRAAS